MRKSLALFIVIAVFMPLALAAMSLAAVRPWLLDRAFYTALVSDARLYEPMLTDEVPIWLIDVEVIAAQQIPDNALSAALREVVTPTLLRDQAVQAVNQAFDQLDRFDNQMTITFDLISVKAAFTGDAGARFAAALAAALPPCDAGQNSIADGGLVSRCIAPGSTTTETASQIEFALPVLVDELPDEIAFNSWPGMDAIGWRFGWRLSGNVRGLLDLAVLLVAAMALAAAVAASALGGSDPRGQLRWLSSSLFAPGSLFVAAGFVLGSPLLTGPVSRSLTTARWNTVYSEAFEQAVAEVIVPAIQRVGGSVLQVGAIVCLAAFVLLIVSLITPRRSTSDARYVEVPVS
ncbi:MAG: hypothetical protein IPM16_00720 [Chloroflexi bacterium]|nr:hypothetical protein [Chloroflexota bacterium]